jgi:hypothetical protein
MWNYYQWLQVSLFAGFRTPFKTQGSSNPSYQFYQLADICALDAALQEAPVVFHPISMDRTLRVGNSVVNDLVRVIFLKIVVRGKRIGKENRAYADIIFDFLKQSILAPILWHRSANLSTALQETDYQSLIASTSALDFPGADLVMHVAGESTDEGFVHFYSLTAPAKLHERTALHGKPNTVHHEPCGFLSDSNCAGHFVGAYSVLAVGNHPDSCEPLVQRDRRILKDSPDLYRELPFSVDAFALPLALDFEESSVLAATGGAHDAARPSQLDHVGQRVIGISEEPDCFLQCVWLSHDRAILGDVV